MAQSLLEKTLDLEDVSPLEFFGVNNEHIDRLRDAYPEVKFIARGTRLRTLGEPDKLASLEIILERMLEEVRQHGPMDAGRLDTLLDMAGRQMPSASGADQSPDHVPPGQIEILRGNHGISIRAKTPGQVEMVAAAVDSDILFAVGPAGTGKTYTAVAIAAKALKDKRVKKIVLVRPAVEAGESLGYLPGDMKEKIDPYLRPLYDALEDMILPDRLKLLVEQNVIEIVPLAYMRGRTLNSAFIILDEAQNATEPQLKMFLTRLGNDSRIIVTGDETQVDLPKHMRSGLTQCLRILQNIDGIGFVRLTNRDVVRHRLVKAILSAYEEETAQEEARKHISRSRPAMARYRPEQEHAREAHDE